MNIPIYQQEVRDGLQEVIANNSIACLAVAETDTAPSPESVERLQKALTDNKDACRPIIHRARVSCGDAPIFA